MKTAELEVPFVIDGWLVDPLASRIRKGDEIHRLEPKVNQVLILLARRAGTVVTRRELEETVWAGSVVGYDAVTNTVNKVRRVFGDDPRRPHIIETISKTGYRLIAEVESPQAGRETCGSAGQRLPEAPSVHTATTSPRESAGIVTESAGGSASMTAPGERPSVLVLPFDDLTSDSDGSHIAEGITEDLITDLSRLSGLLVVSRSTAKAYVRERADARDIGEALDIGYLVEGSVRCVEDRVRVTARLVDTRDAFQLWSERFDLSWSDLLTLTDQITNRIVAVLRVTLSPRERKLVETPTTRDSVAYDQFLRGKSAYWRWTPEANAAAREHYLNAVKHDPSFGLAYAQLARTHFQKWVLDNSKHVEDLDRSLEYARHAVLVENELPQAHSELGWAHLWRGEHDEAISAMQRAIEIDPNYTDGIARLCECLTFAGHPSEGLEYLRIARSQTWYEPFYYRFWAGEAHYYLDQLEEALDELRPAAREQPDFFPVTRFLAAVLVELGRVSEARKEIRRARASSSQLTRRVLARQLPFKHRRDLDRQLDALRVAGLPY